MRTEKKTGSYFFFLDEPFFLELFFLEAFFFAAMERHPLTE